MAYISEEYRFAFFAAPATGSSAVIRALETAGIGEFWPPADIIECDKRVVKKKHSTLGQLRAVGLDAKVDGLLKCVGVRNVFSWYVAKFLRNRTSRMKNVKNKNSWIYRLPAAEREAYIVRLKKHSIMSFSEFVHHKLDRHERLDVYGGHHIGMDVYLHQEEMDMEFATLCSNLRLPSNVKLEHINVTNALKDGQSYRDFYTHDLITLVYDKNRQFFDWFPEYSFEGFDRRRIPHERLAGQPHLVPDNLAGLAP